MKEKKDSEKKIRLQKVIADCGVTSRRKAEELIVQGRVVVNGEVITELGTKVDPHEDAIEVDGKAIDLNIREKIYILLNKPRGFVTTVNDPEGRRTVMDLVKAVHERIYPVGRLDYLSEGLLIMTNDGEIANMIMHPRFNITKVYEVKVFGAISDMLLRKLSDGVIIERELVKPLSVRVIEQLAGKTWLEFRLGEGKNREIRKICEACGITVDKLRRVAIERLSLEGIPPGDYIFVTKKQLLESLGMSKDGSKKATKGDGYISPKKTINVRSKGAQKATPADDRSFYKFRKEFYYDTLKQIKERKQKEEQNELGKQTRPPKHTKNTRKN